MSSPRGYSCPHLGVEQGFGIRPVSPEITATTSSSAQQVPAAPVIPALFLPLGSAESELEWTELV